MQLSDKISHVCSDEHRNKQQCDKSENLIMTNLVINTTTNVKYKLDPNKT